MTTSFPPRIPSKMITALVAKIKTFEKNLKQELMPKEM
jgi:hypothetical protein